MIRGERGSGTVLAVALTAAVLLVAVAAVTAAHALVGARRAAGAADAAALAAADTALGIVPGVPCERARRLAEANGAVLLDCAVAGIVVTVDVGIRTALGTRRSRARAGPAPGSAPGAGPGSVPGAGPGSVPEGRPGSVPADPDAPP